MNRTELRSRLEEHLQLLEQAAENAEKEGFYRGVAELSAQILETVKLIHEYS